MPRFIAKPITAFCCALTGLFTLPLLASEVTSSDKLVQQWLDIEQQNNRLNNQWLEAEPALKQQITLLKAEREQLKAVLDTSQKTTGNAANERTQLLAEQNTLEQDSQQMQTQLTLLRQTLAGIAPQLPPVLGQQWQEEAQALTDPNDTALQLQVALAQLTKLMEFDNRISLHEEILTAPNNKKVLVQQLYLGVARAWFISRDGDYKGIGSAVNGQWQWQFDDELDASHIKNAIAIFEKQQASDFIALPLSLGVAQ